MASRTPPPQAAARPAPRLRIFGMPWYRREDYPRLLEIVADPEKLCATYDEWFAIAEPMVRWFEAQGLLVERVEINPDLFRHWCRNRDLAPNGRARTLYADRLAKSRCGPISTRTH